MVMLMKGQVEQPWSQPNQIRQGAARMLSRIGLKPARHDQVGRGLLGEYTQLVD